MYKTSLHHSINTVRIHMTIQVFFLFQNETRIKSIFGCTWLVTVYWGL